MLTKSIHYSWKCYNTTMAHDPVDQLAIRDDVPPRQRIRNAGEALKSSPRSRASIAIIILIALVAFLVLWLFVRK